MPDGPRRTALAALLVLMLGVPLLPHVAADEYRLAFPADFSSSFLGIDIPRLGPAAAQTRSLIDQAAGGDPDGTVTTEEVQSAEEETKAFFNQGSPIIGKGWTVNGREATSATTDSVEFEGAEGATTSEAPITIRYVHRLYFNVGVADTYQVGVQTMALPANMTVKVTVVAPAGFGITNITGLPGPLFLADDRILMSFDAGAAAADTVITMERGAQVAVPSTPPTSDQTSDHADRYGSWLPVLVLAVLVVALVVWMRVKR